jgi:hypothetical protein
VVCEGELFDEVSIIMQRSFLGSDWICYLKAGESAVIIACV